MKCPIRFHAKAPSSPRTPNTGETLKPAERASVFRHFGLKIGLGELGALA
jgi:hypothetical protein